MQRLLADATKLTGVKYDISNLSDVYSAIHAIQDNLGVTGTTAKEAAETFSGSFAAMKASAENLLGKLALGQDISAELNALATTTSTFLFNNFIPMVFNILKALPGAFVQLITTAGPIIAKQGIELIKNLGAGISEGIPQLLKNAKQIFSQLFFGINQGITEGAPQVLSQFLGFIGQLAAMFAENLPKLVGKFLDFIKQLISTLADNIPQILEKGREIIVNIANGIAEKVPVVINTIANLISNLIGEISKRLPDILAKGAELIANLATGLLKALPSIISAVGNIIGKLLGAIASNLPKLVAKGLELIGALAKGLIQAIPILVSHIPTIVNAIVKALGTLGAEMLKIGKDVVIGLWNGIGNQIDWAVGKIKGMGTRILNAVKGIFGIHSPSKEFAWIGKMNMIGLGNGLTGNLGIVSSAMDDIQGELNRSFESTANINYKNIKNASGNLTPFNQAASVPKNKAMPLILNVVINGRAYKAFVDDITAMQDSAVDLKLAY